MPAYQATFRHPLEHARWTARRLVAQSLVDATLVADALASSITAAEGWTTAHSADLIALILLPDDAANFNPSAITDRSGPPRPNVGPAARLRAAEIARAAELATDPRRAARLFRTACVVAGVHS